MTTTVTATTTTMTTKGKSMNGSGDAVDNKKDNNNGGDVEKDDTLLGIESSSSVVSSRVEIVEILQELEGLLADIDNARDFHTIGGWPILLRMLDSRHHITIQTNAAWAIGTA